MKVFLHNIFKFSVLIMIINMILFIVTYSIYFAPYQKIDLNKQIYLFSDSHGAALGNLSKELNIGNFSMGSDSYEDMYNKIEYLIQKSNVKKIIITADDHTLSTYRDEMNNNDRSSFFKDIFNVKSSNELISIISNKYLKRYFPFLNVKSRDVMLSYFKSKFKPKKIKMITWDKLSLENKKNKSKKRFNFQYTKHSKSELQSKYLTKIIDICNNNNIKIIAIKFPISKEYNSIVGDFSFNADRIFDNENIKVIDLKELYIKDDSFFYDQDHLNKIGRNDFITHLKKVLNE